MKQKIIETIRAVPIAGKTYEEYVEAVAEKLIYKGVILPPCEEMYITDLLIDFDEMGFAPTTACPDPETYAIKWREKITSEIFKLVQEKNALVNNYAKCMKDYAREIFNENTGMVA